MRNPTVRKLLTDRKLRSLSTAKPIGEQYTIWDTLNPHFGVRVSAGGKVAFVAVKRPAGSKVPIRVTLGHFPSMSLEQARKAASAALAELIAGKVPRQERERRHAEQREADANTFAAVVERYKLHVAKARTARQIGLLLDRELVSRWGDRSIATIRRREVIAMVEDIKAGKGPGAARQTLIYAKRVFRFAIGRDLLDASPADHVLALELIGKKVPRQRVLNESEIKALWLATAWDTSDDVEAHQRGRWPVAPFVRLLLLLGVRRGELGAARESQIDLDKGTWLIPSESSKTAEPHLVPLPKIAVDIFRSLPRFIGGDLCFTNDGKRQLGSWTWLKKEIDAKAGLSGWTLHDLRRTARSGWSALGIAPHVCEMMLGHAQPGIIPTYDTHRYEHERRAALAAWARRIAEIVTPSPPKRDNVVDMPLRA